MPSPRADLEHASRPARRRRAARAWPPRARRPGSSGRARGRGERVARQDLAERAPRSRRAPAPRQGAAPSGTRENAFSASAVALAAREQARAGRGDHRGVVGAERGRREVPRRSRPAAPAAASSRRRRRFAATPPTTASASQARRRATARRARATSTSVAAASNDGGHVGALARPRARRAARAQTRHRRLQAAVREVEPGCVGERARQRERARRRRAAASARERGPPGIRQPEQLRDLVEGLADRVVARLAEQLRRGVRLDPVERRVAARHDEPEIRRRERRVGELRRRQVPGQVVHADAAARRADRPAPWRTRGRPAASRASPGPAVTATPSRSLRGDARLCERALHHLRGRPARGRATRARAPRRRRARAAPPDRGRTLAAISRPPRSTAAAISSQELSMPSTHSGSACEAASARVRRCGAMGPPPQPVRRSSFSCSALQSMQSSATGRASSRLTPIASPHISQSPYSPRSILASAASIFARSPLLALAQAPGELRGSPRTRRCPSRRGSRRGRGGCRRTALASHCRRAVRAAPATASGSAAGPACSTLPSGGRAPRRGRSHSLASPRRIRSAGLEKLELSFRFRRARGVRIVSQDLLERVAGCGAVTQRESASPCR